MNKSGLSFVLISVFSAWLLDVMSTWIGLSYFGLHEANPIFLQAPYLWLIAVLSFSVLVFFFKWAPVWCRKTLLVTIMLGSFSPAIHNLIGIWRVILS